MIDGTIAQGLAVASLLVAWVSWVATDLWTGTDVEQEVDLDEPRGAEQREVERAIEEVDQT